MKENIIENRQVKNKHLGKLSRLAESLVGSEIVKLGADIKAKMKSGNKIYNFTIGDFDSSIFPIPKKLEDEIITAYQNKLTTYPPADGILALRESVSAFIKEREGLDFNANEILIAAGGRPLRLGRDRQSKFGEPRRFARAPVSHRRLAGDHRASKAPRQKVTVRTPHCCPGAGARGTIL